MIVRKPRFTSPKGSVGNMKNTGIPGRRILHLNPPTFDDGWTQTGPTSANYQPGLVLAAAIHFGGVVEGTVYRALINVDELEGTGKLTVSCGTSVYELTAVGQSDVLITAPVGATEIAIAAVDNTTLTFVKIAPLIIIEQR